jgi:hypothetical protein
LIASPYKLPAMPGRGGRCIAAAMTVVLTMLSGCGAAHSATSTQTSSPLPPAGEADAHAIEKLPERVSIECSFAGIGGGSGTNPSLERVVEEVEAIAKRASLTGQLRTNVQDVIHELNATNAFNKPTCAPSLGKRLSKATGITAE